MTVDEVVRRLKTDGWCVIEGAIPADDVPGLREAVLAVEARQRAGREAELAKMRARGHRVSTAGVGSAQGLIGAVPEIALHLGDQRILGAAEALLGEFYRVSILQGLVNRPGTERGYWHSDWPFNQTVASHIPAPYADAVVHLSSLMMLSSFNVETGGTLNCPGKPPFSRQPVGRQRRRPGCALPDRGQRHGRARRRVPL